MKNSLSIKIKFLKIVNVVYLVFNIIPSNLETDHKSSPVALGLKTLKIGPNSKPNTLCFCKKLGLANKYSCNTHEWHNDQSFFFCFVLFKSDPLCVTLKVAHCETAFKFRLQKISTFLGLEFEKSALNSHLSSAMSFLWLNLISSVLKNVTLLCKTFSGILIAYLQDFKTPLKYF